jgi:ElaB/YqjD/DUF883 family membrane-anchored ribosome-binding protein
VGETTDQLRRDIETTRADLSRDVDALTYKASPSRMVGDRVDRTRSRLASVKDRVFGSASAAGGTVQGRASSMAGTATDTLGSARDSVSSAASTAADTVTAAPDAARRQTEGNPLAAGLIAFGVGWLVSSLIPPSEAETRAAGEVADAAKEHAQPVVEEAKQAAGQIGENLKEPARDAVESVKSTAQQGAQEVKDQGASSAQQVRQDVRNQAPSSG